jgi:hypothetical protein
MHCANDVVAQLKAVMILRAQVTGALYQRGIIGRAQPKAVPPCCGAGV